MQEDPQEHARLRKHFNAFFTEENIESVYNTLLKNVVSVVDSAAMQAQAGGAAHAEIDMLELAHELIANVVLQVRSRSIFMFAFALEAPAALPVVR